MSRVGFIGLGAMGSPMAARLAAAGTQMTVADCDVGRATVFAAKHGTVVADRPADVARQSDIVISMLPTSAVVESVLLGSTGLLAGLAPGSIVMDMSSGDPMVSRRLAGLVADRGSSFIDAPVSGGVARARSAELAIMVGGSDEAYSRVEGILRLMGSRIMRTGDVGSAHAMKALNNLVSAGGFLIGIEALIIGRKFGLDPNVMIDVLNSSSGTNNSTQTKFKQFVLSRGFNSGFSLELMVKDLSIALELARSNDAAVPFSALCREMWAVALGMKVGTDHTEMARLSAMIARVEL